MNLSSGGLDNINEEIAIPLTEPRMLTSDDEFAYQVVEPRKENNDEETVSQLLDRTVVKISPRNKVSKKK